MKREVGGRFKREGTYVYLWLICADIWQKPAQYCKEIILQLKINKVKILHLKHLIFNLWKVKDKERILKEVSLKKYL